MNFRVVLHLIASYWRRYRWLILIYWLLLGTMALPSITFGPGSFGIPSSMTTADLFPRPDLLNDFEEFSQERTRALVSTGWLLSLVASALAAAVGFHLRGWGAARPVRQREVIAASGLALAGFLILPLLAVVAMIPLKHGLGFPALLHGMADSASVSVPRFIGMALFGAICGRWWRWIVGIFVLAMALGISNMIGFGHGVIPDWFSNPLAQSWATGRHASMWLPVVILAIVVPTCLPRVRARYLVPFCALMIAAFTSVLPEPFYESNSQANWSGKIEPTLENERFLGEVYRESGRRTGESTDPSSGTTDLLLHLQLAWKTKGLPPGTFADWKWGSKVELKSKGQVIAAGRPANQSSTAEVNMAAVDEVLHPEAKPLDTRNASTVGPTNDIHATFIGKEPKDYDTTSLSMNLTGTVYRLEKILDAPFGQPIRLSVGENHLHARRLDISHGMPLPVAEVSIISPCSHGVSPTWIHSPLDSWQVFIEYPAGVYRPAAKWYEQRGWLTPGCPAVRALFGPRHEPQDEADRAALASARLIILQRTDLALVETRYESPELPFEAVTLSSGSGRAPLGGRAPSLGTRPDPQTASASETDDWLREIRNISASDDWHARAVASYVSRHPKVSLSRASYTTWIPEGSALVIASPENQKDEIIATLPRRNRPPYGNWLSGVVLARGWAKDAAPQIHRLVQDGELDLNPYHQLLIASLEEPASYPELAEGTAATQWYESYERVRNVPGIEPRLTQAINRRYSAMKLANFDPRALPGAVNLSPHARSKREIFDYCLIPAAHGNAEAFALLLHEWKSVNEVLKPARLHQLRKLVDLPDGDDDAPIVLREKRPADFHYDSLARWWVLSEKPE